MDYALCAMKLCPSAVRSLTDFVPSMDILQGTPNWFVITAIRRPKPSADSHDLEDIFVRFSIAVDRTTRSFKIEETIENVAYLFTDEDLD